jgi:hypothetical protein
MFLCQLHQIKGLIGKILELLISVENESTNDYKLWHNFEHDSATNEFERLSQLGLINLRTKLNVIDVKVVFQLLISIVHEDYCVFDTNNPISYVDDSTDELIAQYELDKSRLETFRYPNLWLKYLRIACEDRTIISTIQQNNIDDNFQRIDLDINDIGLNIRLSDTGLVNIIM